MFPVAQSSITLPGASSPEESFDLVGALPEGGRTVGRDASAPNLYEPAVVAAGGGARCWKAESGKSVRKRRFAVQRGAISAEVWSTGDGPEKSGEGSVVAVAA
jgi:hypothetical protein